MSDDCILRQTAIDIFKNAIGDKYPFICEPILITLSLIPSVTQKPKTGHWMFQKIKQGKRMWCSNCNSAFDLCCNQIKRYNEITNGEDIWAYCPWCGAKMEVSDGIKI